MCLPLSHRERHLVPAIRVHMRQKERESFPAAQHDFVARESIYTHFTRVAEVGKALKFAKILFVLGRVAMVRKG